MTLSTVSIQFSDGSVIDSWIDFSYRETYTDPLGSFEFTIAPPPSQLSEARTMLTKGELVGLKVNGAPQASMIVQTTRETISPHGGVEIHCACTNPLVTAYQGGTNPDYAFHAQADTPVEKVILDVMAPYGFSEIITDSAGHVDAITGIPIGGHGAPVVLESLKHQDSQAHENETAYAFCARILTRLGVCLRLRHDGVLLVGRPDYEQDVAYTLVQAADGSGPDGDYFAGEVEIEDTNDGQFSEVIVRGARPDPVSDAATARPSAAVIARILHKNQHATVGDEPVAATKAAIQRARATAAVSAIEVRQSRPQYTSTAATYKPTFRADKSARDNARCASVAKLVLGLAAAKAFTVSGSVAGFVSRTGRVWSVDTVARVYIQTRSLDENMWILERTLKQSRGGGQTCALKLLPLGALVLGDLP